MNGGEIAKRSSIGSTVRKRLSDITNSVAQPKSPMDLGNENDASSTKGYIDNLIKENMALVKLIQDKNKIIELSGVELQKLRVNLQKMQLQNWNLAQANSHMLAELNLNKAKLKSLQHEIVCKEAVFKAKNMEVKEHESNKQESINGTMNEKQDGEAVVGNSQPNTETKDSKSNRRLRATRSRSMSHSTASQQAAKEAAAEKRRRLRRQSASSRMQQQEPAENLFELEEMERQFINEKHGCEGVAQQPSNRTSLGRPLRRAAGKVQSYKEIPLNVKMRRKD